jgi:hypothetical protein
MKVVLFLLIIIISKENSVAQQQVAGPFTYSPPTYNNVWIDANTQVSTYKRIVMDTIPSSPPSHNGLIVSFDVTLSEDENNKPLISFYDKNVVNLPILRIYYSNQSIVIRRYNVLKSNYYSYKVYDQMFNFDVSEHIIAQSTYTMKVYFMSNFIFIVTTGHHDVNNHYLTPLFFGLDNPLNGNSVTNKFINRDKNAVIRIGVQRNDDTSYPPYISNTKIYSFVYDTFRNELQQNFSFAQ